MMETLGKEQEMAREAYHEPVLTREIVELLKPAPGRLVLDGTLGGGGHSERMLEAGANVIGLDQDPEAIAFSNDRLAKFGERFVAVQANFADAGSVLDQLGVAKVDAVLLDLGVSSRQLDAPERGFSFMADGPLDMRMDPARGQTAADILNSATEHELAEIFWKWGEETASRRIAAHLVRRRAERPFARTLDLAQAVETVLPRRGRIHPATRVFQALRIAVNRELEVLERALEMLSGRIAPGGRMGVISFHSLEDRIVKRFFRDRSAEWIDRPEWPEPRKNPSWMFNTVTSGPVTASQAEAARNPRSRSAKLRVAERIGHGS